MIEIRRAENAGEIAAVSALWSEYWQALGLPPSFQGFAEQLRTLPGEFAAPQGFLLLAIHDSEAAGTIALRPLHPGACEVKRLYVPARFRGHGLGKKLLLETVSFAKQMSYSEMYCDTLPSMETAAGLYRRLGFVSTVPYSEEPTPGALYFKLELRHGTP